MSALILLRSLFACQAWANDEQLEKIASLDRHVHNEERHAAMRLISHCHVVADQSLPRGGVNIFGASPRREPRLRRCQYSGHTTTL
ncbi:exported hypothetical protein [Mesorhizobium metallidurans STM 2683]|uniref:Uncharacterized protein n=1 Tax=Mesorhizobium metallidurans STM 2683 TaxID=1297569 RepID=M5EPI2_9HYPH|nr:hypothetical protein [Mesorhizobium metallidurans]CCV06060.1 exported hypothetical protein [Mesorhizobium metallidurans STM 2683]